MRVRATFEGSGSTKILGRGPKPQKPPTGLPVRYAIPLNPLQLSAIFQSTCKLPVPTGSTGAPRPRRAQCMTFDSAVRSFVFSDAAVFCILFRPPHLWRPPWQPLTTNDHELQHLANLASHRHCTERIQAAWAGFLTKREERLEQQRRLGEACEKVAENILEDLFTAVLDWSLSDFNNQVEHTDIVLTDHSIKRLVVEVKRPGSLAWNRCAVESALAQAKGYADKQKITTVAVSDGVMLYAANVAHGGLRDRVFVSLSHAEPPLDLGGLSVQAIWRERESNEAAGLRILPEEPIEIAPEAGTGVASECLLHPKYHLQPASPTWATIQSRVRGSSPTYWRKGRWMPSACRKQCNRS